MRPQLLVGRKKKDIQIYYPGFVLSARDLAPLPGFLQLHPFDLVAPCYHVRELIQVGELDDFPFPYDQLMPEIYMQFDATRSFASRISSHASLLCSAVEEEIMTLYPQATHYVFSSLRWGILFLDDGTASPDIEVESYIRLYRFRPLRQRSFPFVADSAEQLDLFLDRGLSRDL